VSVVRKSSSPWLIFNLIDFDLVLISVLLTVICFVISKLSKFKMEHNDIFADDCSALCVPTVCQQRLFY